MRIFKQWILFFIFLLDWSNGIFMEHNFCIDSDGTQRGIFATWTDASGCRCECQFTGKVALSICEEECQQRNDPFSIAKPELSPRLDESNLPSHVDRIPLDSHCHDETSRLMFSHGQTWMSARHRCAKCHCFNGSVDCSTQLLHCRMLCLPGQTAVATGPCCTHRCVGEAYIQKDLRSCEVPDTTESHPHGEPVLRPQTCVDQSCYCNDGEWICLDTCTPLDELPCAPEDRIYWDPFCCPRCKGKQECELSVPEMYWMKAPMTSPQHFESILHNAVDEEPFRTRKRLDHQSHLPPDEEQLFADTTTDTNQTLITVPPGQHVVTYLGQCVCTDGKLRCFRNGAGIWHDTDCFYPYEGGGRFYAFGEHWKDRTDDCLDCQCFENRSFGCSRTNCKALFLCPLGTTPISVTGECCPTQCVDSKTAFKQKTQPSRNFVISSKILENEDLKMDHNAVRSTDLNDGIECVPLGQRSSSSPNFYLLPSGSAMIIRRACVSLRCVCTQEGKWVCMDYCIPCLLHENHHQYKLDAGHALDNDGCCPTCDKGHILKTENNKFLASIQGYTNATVIFLVLLVLISLLVIVICFFTLKCKYRLKRLSLVRKKSPPNLDVPLTVSTIAEAHDKSDSPPTTLVGINEIYATTSHLNSSKSMSPFSVQLHSQRNSMSKSTPELHKANKKCQPPWNPGSTPILHKKEPDNLKAESPKNIFRRYSTPTERVQMPVREASPHYFVHLPTSRRRAGFERSMTESLTPQMPLEDHPLFPSNTFFSNTVETHQIRDSPPKPPTPKLLIDLETVLQYKNDLYL